MWERDLLIQLIRRRVMDRYIGSSSILLWVLISPLIPLLLNMFVFFLVARVPEIQAMGAVGYAAFAFSGLLVFRVVQRAGSEGCDLLISNLEMLRSVNFPLAHLSLAAVGALMVDVILQLVVMLALLVWSGQGVTSSLIALPVALAILLATCIGGSWLASIAGYTAREVQELLTVGLTVLLYLSPALFPIEAAPSLLRRFIELNPLSHLIIVFRDVLLPTGALHWQSWLYASILAGGLFGAGLLAITRMKRVVGDLI